MQQHIMDNTSAPADNLLKIEWVLSSLAKISNQQTINEVIDEILKLLSDVFSADHATVSLIDSKHSAHSISYYRAGEKKEPISYPLAHSPDQKVQQKNTTCFLNNLQELYPENPLFTKLNINSYFGGPIVNAQGQVIGLMTVMKKQKIEINNAHNTLFLIFLNRINLEIERLLNYRKIQFISSIPQQDPNPVIRIMPSGDVLFANAPGKIVLNYWMKLYSGIPESIMRNAHIAEVKNQVIRIEIEIESKIYLFAIAWIPDFKQITIYGTDISQLKATEKNVLNLARFDALTQIANRQFFEEKLVEKLHEHTLEGESLSLLLIDLDNFKTINDTLGHSMGDKVLQAATKRMVHCIRQEDFIARLGGDEFIVLLNHSNTDTAVLVTEKIIDVLARTFQFGEYHMKITASIGIVTSPKTGISPSSLLKNANTAMYQAKKHGKNNYIVFLESEHHIQDKKSDLLKNGLTLAASHNELYIDYQPIFDISNDQIIGVEAFLRWFHPELGLLMPNEFIPIAEQTGCIHLISQWLIEQTLKDFNQFLALNPQIKLSLNISLSQLNDARFLDSLCDSLLENKIKREQMILDIAERTIAPHFKQMVKCLKNIRKVGLNICLDNFGSPQISLTKLLALPIDYLKLDQLLLNRIEKNDKNRMLLETIITLAKKLNVNIIQKGIETKEHHEIIKALGCQSAQGYYYCQPLQVNELLNFMAPSK